MWLTKMWLGSSVVECRNSWGPELEFQLSPIFFTTCCFNITESLHRQLDKWGSYDSIYFWKVENHWFKIEKMLVTSILFFSNNFFKSFPKGINPLPHLLKTLWKKEKMLVTSIFSFFHVFYPYQNKIQFFSHNYFVVWKCFQFGLV